LKKKYWYVFENFGDFQNSTQFFTSNSKKSPVDKALSKSWQKFENVKKTVPNFWQNPNEFVRRNTLVAGEKLFETI
jgi:hypothetical protein